jgi:oligopeptide transport system substrate-binding protein
MPDANQVGVRAVDDHTLRLTFENRIGYVLQLVTSTAFWPVPRLKVQSLGDKWIEAGNIVSNGPYRLTEWKHDDHMMLVPNPNYWGRKPGVDRVEIRLIPDAEANALRAYEAGELEYAPVSTTDLDRIRGSSQYGPLRFAAIPRLFAVWMDTGHAPFNDVRVRRALYLALDRDKISHVFNGLLAPAWTVIPHRVPGHSDDIRLKGSIEDARRLLAEAGYPEGQRFPPATLVVRSTLQERLFGQLAQSMWKVNLGVGIKVQTLETQAFRAFVQASERRPYDMMSLTGTADIPDPWIYHNYLFGPNVDYYHSRWRDNRYVQLLRPAEVEADPQKRTELYRQLDRIVIEDDTVIIPWAYGNVAYLTRPSVQGLDIFFTAPGPSLRNLVMQP